MGFNITPEDESRAKGAAIGAVVGSFVLGPLGAAVGAALGASNQVNKRNVDKLKGEIQYHGKKIMNKFKQS